MRSNVNQSFLPGDAGTMVDPTRYLHGSRLSSGELEGRLAAHMATIRSLLTRLEKLVAPNHLSTVSQLLSELQAFRVRVAMVGQVKAGKTMLTSALVGLPGLLPSDINPWTSVITTIHMNTPKSNRANAVFSFYTEQEWANLTQNGGPLGEMAERADFKSELADMRTQIAEMQARTEERLGANFGLLLGAQHSFSGFSKEIIERYVCLGEKDAPALGGGRYADLTKTADLYVDNPNFGFPIAISDTPGVNDPFLARERATVETLSQSDICVVMLTAHQSFSTVDLALLRILLALRPEQIILFVNRIDELEDPARQIPEIDQFIREILHEKGLSSQIPIVYGSAAWAEKMLLGPVAAISPGSLRTLTKLGAERSETSALSSSDDGTELGFPPFSVSKATDLSGLHELRALISDRSIQGIGGPFATEILLQASDVARQSVLLIERALHGDLPLGAKVDIQNVIDRLDTMMRDLDNDCTTVTTAITDQMLLTMSNAYREFIDAETASIRELFKAGRDLAGWSPDTEGLRKSLNRAYRSLAEDGCRAVAAIYERAADQVTAIYSHILQEEGRLFSVRAPGAFEPSTPAALMRTMAIDMKTTWIGNWLARASGAKNHVARFQSAVTAEMAEFLREMREVHVVEFINQSRKTLHDFLADHLSTLQTLAAVDGSGHGREIRQKLGVEIELGQRMVALKGLVSELDALTDVVCADFDLVVE